MKKIVSLILLSAATLGLYAASIPKNSVVYLDVSQEWCCKATYAVCTSSGGDAARIMKPVEGLSGVYSYTVTMDDGLQENFRFGWSDVVIPHDQAGWNNFGDPKDHSGSWSAAKPYYIVTGSNGSGYWAAAPVSSGAPKLDSVVVITPTSCIDSIYNVVVSVYFSGAPCSMTLTGDQWEGTEKIKDLKNPMVIVKKDIKEPAGKEHNVTVTLYSATNYTGEIGSKKVTYVSPEIECEVETDLGDKCTNEPLTLTAETEGDVYMWSNGETEREITVTPTEGAQTYTADVYKAIFYVEYNMMANADFEEVPPSASTPPEWFTSIYTYVGWVPTTAGNYYDISSLSQNLYAIVHDAHEFWRDFMPLQPHGGNYYALFDAGKAGHAWKATTEKNPDLKVEKDTTYLFSYWAASPNSPKYSDNPAVLQFRIKYYDAVKDSMITVDLGARDTVSIYKDKKNPNGWFQQTVQWVAPCNSDYIEISVEDLNNEKLGNDFCLDDIMFQKASVKNMLLARTEIFHVNGINCGTPPEPQCTDNWLRTKWNDMLFVDNSAGEFVSYQWYVNGEAIEGATEQYYRAPQSLTQSTDLYSVRMQKADGTVIISCEKTFSQVSPSREEYPAPEKKQVIFRRYHVVGSNFRIVVTGYDDGSVEANKELY